MGLFLFVGNMLGFVASSKVLGQMHHLSFFLRQYSSNFP